MAIFEADTSPPERVLPLEARCDPRFRKQLEAQFDIGELERHAGSVIGLWRDATIAYFNPAWTKFAADNGGYPAIDMEWGLGRNYLKAIPAPLLPFYENLLFSAQIKAEELTPRTHHYECSSPELYREFAMQLFPFRNGEGCLIINSVAKMHPHELTSQRPAAPDPTEYMDAHGSVRQCAHCRRVQHPGAARRWDWVPEWVTHSPRYISHGICLTCYNYYFKQDFGDAVPEGG